jgi:hypothetical protein
LKEWLKLTMHDPDSPVGFDPNDARSDAYGLHGRNITPPTYGREKRGKLDGSDYIAYMIVGFCILAAIFQNWS